jgi:hypothetical protein
MMLNMKERKTISHLNKKHASLERKKKKVLKMPIIIILKKISYSTTFNTLNYTKEK